MKTRSFPRRALTLALLLALLLPLLSLFTAAEGEEWPRAAVVNGTGVRVRTGPGTNNAIVTELNSGHALTVTGDAVPSESAETPNPWYPVTFRAGEAEMSGYMYSDYVYFPPENPDPPAPNLSFEEQLAAFPESYKASIRALHEAHPSWNFEAVYTGLDWNVVQQNENVFKRSLINYGPESFRSTASGCYDWNTDTYYVLEGRNWYQAAPAVVAYYMDPRNFLNETDIFQFEKLSYDPGLQTAAGVDAMLAGSFMAGASTVDLDGNPVTYTETFVRAAAEYGVALYHLVARCIQEIGRDGKATGACGTVAGYPSIYNFYSIGAGSGAMDGIVYAAQTDPETYRPWNTQYKSILAGAQFLSDGYISAGQDTLYFQKFSVVGNKLYWHQYMASIGSPNGEGHTVRASYARLGLLETAFTFRIPVYENMPVDPCALPPETGSPNCYLSSLTVSGYDLTPSFDTFSQTDYDLILPEGVTMITVNATPISGKASVSGAVGTVALHAGRNDLTITCRASSGAVRDYRLHVVLPGDTPELPDPAVPSGWDPPYYFASGDLVTGITPGTDCAAFLDSLGLYGNARATLLSGMGDPVFSGPVATGLVLNYFDGGADHSYTLVVRGDLNGDGIIDAVDLLIIRKAVRGLTELTSAQAAACDTDLNGVWEDNDMAIVRDAILGRRTIPQ